MGRVEHGRVGVAGEQAGGDVIDRLHLIDDIRERPRREPVAGDVVEAGEQHTRVVLHRLLRLDALGEVARVVVVEVQSPGCRRGDRVERGPRVIASRDIATLITM